MLYNTHVFYCLLAHVFFGRSMGIVCACVCPFLGTVLNWESRAASFPHRHPPCNVVHGRRRRFFPGSLLLLFLPSIPWNLCCLGLLDPHSAGPPSIPLPPSRPPVSAASPATTTTVARCCRSYSWLSCSRDFLLLWIHDSSKEKTEPS